jgi:hypothetical protein
MPLTRWSLKLQTERKSINPFRSVGGASDFAERTRPTWERSAKAIFAAAPSCVESGSGHRRRGQGQRRRRRRDGCTAGDGQT